LLVQNAGRETTIPPKKRKIIRTGWKLRNTVDSVTATLFIERPDRNNYAQNSLKD